MTWDNDEIRALREATVTLREENLKLKVLRDRLAEHIIETANHLGIVDVTGEDRYDVALRSLKAMREYYEPDEGKRFVRVPKPPDHVQVAPIYDEIFFQGVAALDDPTED